MSKKASNILIVFCLFLLLAGFGVLASRFLSPEDSWICENGQWAKHGNPSAPQPTLGCGEILKPVDETQNKVSIKVFFGNTKLDPDGKYCERSYVISRTIAKTDALARAALEELLKGPAASEKTQGFFTSINPNVKILSLKIENGVARVDFDDTLQKSVGGSCRTAAIRSQITETLKQFSTVKSVVISINGKTEKILQP